MFTEIAKKTTEIVTSEEVKEMKKFSKESRQIKKLQKLGAVSIKEFDALKTNVEIQKYGFLAIASIEAIRLVKGLTKKPVEVAEAVEPIHYSMSDSEIDAVASALLDKMNIIVDQAGGLGDDPEDDEHDKSKGSSSVDDLPDEIVDDDEENG